MTARFVNTESMRRIMSGFFKIVMFITISSVILEFTQTTCRANGQLFMNADSPVLNLPFSVTKQGESCALFHLNSPDTSWSDKANQGLVFEVAVDGRFAGHVLVAGSGGDSPPGGLLLREYSACLGELPAGNHDLTLTLDPDISPAEHGSIDLSFFQVRTVTRDEVDYPLVKYAPVLYERAADKGTDVSLLLFANPVTQNGKTTIEYHVLFSNEDGGTGRNPAILMSRYGRVTDIEWVYSITIDDSAGTILNELYQGSNHEMREFSGRHMGSHPVLRVATDNGNFEQDGETPVRVGLMPVSFHWGEDRPREAIMDLYPWTFRISSDEMFVERKASHDENMRSAMLGNMRDYIYIDYDAENFNAKKTLCFEVKLKNSRHWYSTNPGKDVPFFGTDGLIQFSGWYRTNIKLPPGTEPEDVEGIRILGTEDVSYRVKHMRAFMLDVQYNPLQPFFQLTESVTLTPSNRTAAFPVTTTH